MCILISCESGGQRVPTLLQPPASRAQDGPTIHAVDRSATANAFQSDPAALYVARRMASRLVAPLVQYEYSLDAIDVTRSLRHPKLFSRYTRSLPAEQKQRLVDEFYAPYRTAVRSMLSQMFQRFPFVVHLSIRTFDLLGPKNQPRRADIGLLYDPTYTDEADLCADWTEDLYFEADMIKVRRNYPRRGTTDSLTKAMRAEFADQEYLGVELLLNRAWAGRAIQIRDIAIDQLSDTLGSVLQLQQSDAA